MNVINRLFVAILALAWIALMAGLMYLVWNPGEFVEVNGSALSGRFEVFTDTSSEQTLATIILALLMLPALLLLFMEATVRDRRARELSAEAREARDHNKRLEARIDELEDQLESERKRDADVVRRVADRDERVVVDEPERERDRVTAPRRWHLFGR